MVQDPRATTGAGSLRRLNEPKALAVEANTQGLPTAILWRGTYRRVCAIHDTWRIDDEWWRDEIARRYFVVEFEGGRRLTVFCDLVRDTWYEQGYQEARSGVRTGRIAG